MPRQRRALLLAAILSLLVRVGAGDLDPPAGAPLEQQQQQQLAPAPPQQEQEQPPPPAAVEAPAQEQAQAPPQAEAQASLPADAAPVAPRPAADGAAAPFPTDAAAPDAAPVAPPAAPAADGADAPLPPTVPALPGVPAAVTPAVPVVLPPTDNTPLSPRQAVEINDPIVQKAAALAMVDVDPVTGKAIGWRVVHADKQSIAAGTNYYLQIELRTKTRCEVHEKRVFVEAKTGTFIVGRLGDLLPCDASLPPADYMTKGKKGWRTERGGAGEE